MTRQTSIDAYHHLVDEGVLPAARARVYATLYKIGPCTASEMYEHICKSEQRGALVARLGELRDMGVVTELDPRPCLQTGMSAIVWDVTARVDPLPYTKPPTLSEKVKAYRVLLLEIIEWMDAEKHVEAAASAREIMLEIEGGRPCSPG